MPSPQHDGGQPRRAAAVDLSESSSPSKKSEAGRTAASSPAFNDGVSCDGGECVDAVGDKCVKCCAQLQSRQLDAWRRSMSRFGVDLRRLLVHIEKVTRAAEIDGDLLTRVYPGLSLSLVRSAL